MDYILNLKDKEPCDIYLKSVDNRLYAVVVQSRKAYAKLLDMDYVGPRITLVCVKHAFNHKNLKVTVVEDMALIDGIRCTKMDLNEAGEEAIYALSCN